jgi:hypothetical protein
VSQLQIVLSVLAAVVLLGLYLHEKWSQRRRLNRLQQHMRNGVDDALLRPAEPAATRAAVRGSRVEPFLDSDEPEAPATRLRDDAPGPIHASVGVQAYQEQVAPDDERATPSPGEPIELPSEPPPPPGEVSAEDLPTPTALLAPGWAEDPLLDCAIEIRCARALDGVRLIDAAAQLGAHDWRLSVHFVVWDVASRQWILPDRFGYYSDALAAIQLADRHGSASAQTLNRFVEVLSEVANSLNADLDRPDVDALVQQAGQLDELCGRFDMRLGITLRANNGSWGALQIRQLAQYSGFVPLGNADGPGYCWAWQTAEADGAATITGFTLRFDPQQADRVLLEFDVALVPDTLAMFRVLADQSAMLAARLDARVVDDNGGALDERSFHAIETQLAKVIGDMKQAGIEPGSVRARRLYV